MYIQILGPQYGVDCLPPECQSFLPVNIRLNYDTITSLARGTREALLGVGEYLLSAFVGPDANLKTDVEESEYTRRTS